MNDSPSCYDVREVISCLENRQLARQSMGQCSEPETLPMSVTGREGFVTTGNV